MGNTPANGFRRVAVIAAVWAVMHAGMCVQAAQEVYREKRAFLPVPISANATPYSILAQSKKMGTLIGPFNVLTNVNNCTELERVAWGQGSPAAAWAKSVPTQIAGYGAVTDPGWIKGTKQSSVGTYGAYIWMLQNHLSFATSAEWEHLGYMIDRVFVGTLGDYYPAEDVSLVFPQMDEQPTSNTTCTLLTSQMPTASETVQYSYSTKAYYRLLLPANLDGKHAQTSILASEQEELSPGVIVCSQAVSPRAKLLVRSCGVSGYERILTFSDRCGRTLANTVVLLNGNPVSKTFTVNVDSAQEAVYDVSWGTGGEPDATVMATLTVKKNGYTCSSDSLYLLNVQVEIDPEGTVDMLCWDCGEGEIETVLTPRDVMGDFKLQIKDGATVIRTLTNGPSYGGVRIDTWDGKADNGLAAEPKSYKVYAEWKVGSATRTDEEMPLTVVKVEFLEDATTDYNFSPSLGETGKFKVKVSPTPPAGGFTDLAFQLYIVRETGGGTDQFIEWLDVADPDYALHRTPLDFGTMSFEWDGIPQAIYGGANQPEAAGPETFSGLSSTEHAHRCLPPVTEGQPIPPPLCTAVARVYSPITGETFCEARKQVFIPQVVLLVYEDAAVSLLRLQLKAADNTVLYDSISSSQWTAMKTQIKNHLVGFYNATDANIRILDDATGLSSPYTTVRMVDDTFYPSNFWGWGGGCDFDSLRPNADPKENMAKILVFNHRWIINDAYENNEISPPPLGPDNLSWSVAITACHELGHSLGLVYNNRILNGTDFPGCHNQGASPAGRWQHLSPILDKEHLYPSSDWIWKDVNIGYLKFILPKE